MTVETLHAGRLELGEGPTYDPDTDTAWWFDIVGRGLFEHCLSGGETRRHALPRMASVMARIDSLRQLVAMEDGLYIRAVADGALDLLHPLEADNAKTRSNDGRTHQSGTLWIGTMGKAAEPGAGAIYWFDGHELRRLYDRISIPNAICFSPDGTTGYFADSAEGLLYRVNVDPATGLPFGEPGVFFDNRGGAGGLDGAVVDTAGVVWNARWGAGAVDAYTPDGKRMTTIEFPAKQTSCPAFVGKDGDGMLVTSAWQGLDAAARAADPQAGDTFIIRGGFKGRFDPPFQLPADR